MAWEKPGLSRAEARITLDADRDPWELQSEETPEAFADFARYRDAPPGERKLRALADEDVAARAAELAAAGQVMDEAERKRFHGIRAAWWSKKSSHYRWRERAAAYDAHLDKVSREARERGIARAVEKAAERQQAIASALVALAGRKTQRLHTLIQKAEQSEAAGKEAVNPLDDITLPQLLELATKGIALERAILGMAAEAETPVEPVAPPDGPRRRLSFEEAKRAAVEALRQDRLEAAAAADPVPESPAPDPSPEPPDDPPDPDAA